MVRFVCSGCGDQWLQIMSFIRTLTFRVLVGSCLLLIILFALYSYFSIRFSTNQMMAQVIDSANRVSDVIKNSTQYSMLLNRKDDVYQIIQTIGREQGVEGIRIYNKRGVIIFSTDKSEELSTVNMHAEACFVCHESDKPLQSLPISNRARIYTAATGHRIVGLINPIRNEPSCSSASCHAHPVDKTVLGVLDVRMSLEKVDSNITQARRKLVLYAAVMILIVMSASGLFLFLMVHRPVSRLMEGTRQISSGNLKYVIPHDGSDELGELAIKFNEMTRVLNRAEEENKTWAATLEKRIREKTEELQRVNEQIVQIEKMASLGKLAATVAHELNNPLEGILTYSKLISKRLRKTESDPERTAQALEDLDLIIREVQRCGNIVKNLLLFSKKQVAEIGLVPVRGIIDRAVQLMQHHFKISNVEFAFEDSEPDATVMCDENQIQQALVALFVNAVEAMPGGGMLKVTVDRISSGDLQVRIADSGMGIAPEDLPHIFEPFFTTKKEGKGVGLGLSIVYGIIERHGGHVSAESELGKGTAFTLTFPPAAMSHPRVEAKDSLSPHPA
jgi:two-component system NtrC family sensor kinase